MLLRPHEIDWILKHGNAKQIKAAYRYLSNPLWDWKPRPDKVHLWDEQTGFLTKNDPGCMVLLGGIGAGKSITGAVKVARLLLSTAPPRDLCPFWLVSQNFDMACGNMYSQKLSTLIPQYLIQDVKWYAQNKAQPLSVILKPHSNGNRWLIDCKSVQSDPQKLMGTEIYGAWVDEYCPLEIFRVVQQRIRVPNEDGTTPRGNFVYTLTPQIYELEFQKMHDDRLPGFSWYHVNTACNDRLPEGYLQGILANELEERKGTVQYGFFASFQGSVYPMFNEKLHVCAPYPIPSHWSRYRGIDFGLSRKFACLWLAKNPFADRWVVYDEYWQEGQTYRDHAEAIKTRHPTFDGLTYSDPANPEGRFELMNQGIVSYSAKKDVELGINTVRSHMQTHRTGEPKLHIFSTCKRLIEELKNYKWHPLKPGAVVKENDDMADCLRYVIYSEKHNTTPAIQQAKPKPRILLKY